MRLRVVTLLFHALLLLAGCSTTGEKALPLKCHIYAVAPPEHYDEKASRYIVEAWKKSIAKKLRKCDRFIDQDKALAAFRLLNLDYDKPFDEGDFGRQQAERLQMETNATHLIDLKYKIKKGVLQIRPNILRLTPFKHEQKIAVAGIAKVALPKNSPIKQASKKAIQVRGLSFLPNSVRVGYSNYYLRNDLVEDGTLEQLDRRSESLLPPLITGISVTSVEHPFGFDTWDISFRGLFSLNAFFVDESYSFRTPANPPLPASDPKEYRVVYTQVAPEISGEVSLHWILGATYMSLGIGGGMSYLNDTYDRRFGFVITIPLTIGHRAFITERIYLDLFVYAGSFNPGINNEVFACGQRSGAFFGLGYFFPDAKTYLRRAL